MVRNNGSLALLWTSSLSIRVPVFTENRRNQTLFSLLTKTTLFITLFDLLPLLSPSPSLIHTEINRSNAFHVPPRPLCLQWLLVHFFFLIRWWVAAPTVIVQSWIFVVVIVAAAHKPFTTHVVYNKIFSWIWDFWGSFKFYVFIFCTCHKFHRDYDLFAFTIEFRKSP